MPVLFIVVGLLLMLFGGGCALLAGGIFISDPKILLNDLSSLVPLYLGVAIAPLVGGFFLFRHGLRLDRERRRSGQAKTDGTDRP
jgi:hypothetical protein